ncbi:hypothetical protein LOK49_LG06G03019 [Camellia lanceoleosa]|uniref:Uncharacterized protein n=1 Tax=Camellia lanceoleosa TaxID=1840588 RepID=A0ACC0HF25_9ERIC|nr:hypothetical protein LOK49_LG06G03019 [Camellia lanceoleosa]
MINSQTPFSMPYQHCIIIFHSICHIHWMVAALVVQIITIGVEFTLNCSMSNDLNIRWRIMDRLLRLPSPRRDLFKRTGIS